MKKQSPQEREAVELFEYAARNLIKEFCHKQDLQFEFENSDMVKNEDIAFWNIGLVTIDGDENDPNSYQVAGNLNYDDFIKKLPINKYKFIDASYIMVEPLSKEEILDLLK